MKNLLLNIKFMFSLCKKYIVPIILIIILGGIDSISNVYTALVTKRLLDSATKGETSLMYKTLILLAILFIIGIVIRSISPIIATYTTCNISKDIQERLYKHLIRSKWYEYSKYHSGDMLTRITSDVDTITNVIVNTIPTIISLSLLLITSFFALLTFSPKLAITSLIIAPLSIIFAKIYGRKLKILHIESQEAEATYRSFVQESLQNLLIIKTFCVEKQNFLNLNSIQDKKIKLSLKKSCINAISKLILSIGSVLGFFLAFLWGSINLYYGTGTFGTLTALIQLMGNIQGPFSGLASSLPQISASLGSAERIMEIERIPIETPLLPCEELLINSIHHASIQIKNVDFSYKPNIPVLKDISFNIKPGEILAIVGPSGEGKTTLLRLLLSLLDYNNGEIIFKTSSHNFEASCKTRNMISYVPQGNTLFSGTIRDNLLLGNILATDAEIEQASRLACCWSFIESLDNKLSTIIGENGIGLSEGQAQRLSITRAFLREKPILILDEATSALDNNTELEVLASIRNLNHKPTCIIITHRPSALNICNRILKLQNNTIVEISPSKYSKTASL